MLFELAAGMLRPATGFDVDPAGRRLYGQLLSGAVLLGVVWVLLRRAGATLPGRAAAVGLAGTAVMVLVSLEAPGIAAGLCILVLGFAHGNRALAGLGGAALLLYAGGYYYELDLTLLAKSQVLAATGGVLLALRWVLLRWLGPPSSPRRHPGIRAANFRDPLPAGEKAPKVIDPRPRIVIGMAGALLVLAAVNASIVGKERLLALPQHAAGRPGAGEPVSADGRAVVRLDERSVASFVRLDDDRPLAADEALLRYRVRAGRLKFASDAFYFQEGTAEAYQAARYGRYRVADDGELLLTSLHDEHLNRLPVGSP
ncbi:MAG: GDYXXLXY domain-containing protein [Xanthomonadales bacterium]|nr:GDYXXLXY domain-containing protein [Xanthomonadales bacterium]